MRIMNIRYSNKKKVRGARRKCLQMIDRITKLTNEFPNAREYKDYWHIHLPVAQTFIDSTKTPAYVKKVCIQTLLDRVKYLIESKSNVGNKVRVVACIQPSRLWNSQIIIFFDENYFNSFFDRNNSYQKWTLLPQSRSLARERNLKVPSGFMEKGYIEEIYDEDFTAVSELWYFGELL